MPEIVQEIGAAAGIAAVVGLAVLSALYFSQARDVKRLREWAGRAPERADTGAPAAVPGRVVAQPQTPQAAQTRPGGPPPVPTPRPAAAAAAGATPATAQQSKPAQGAPGGPVPATAAGAAGAAAAGAATKPDGADAKPDQAAKPDEDAAKQDGEQAKPGTPQPVGAQSGGPATAAAAAGAAASGAAASGTAPPASAGAAASGTASPASAEAASGTAPPSSSPPASAAPPSTPARASAPPPSSPPPVAPRRAPQRPAARQPGGRSPQETQIIPPRRQEPWYRRLGGTYIALIVVGVLVVGGGVAFGVSQLTKDDSPDSGNAAQTGNDKSGGSGKQNSKGGAAVKPGDVTVAVLNGTTVPGLAATLSDQVSAAGFKIGTITNFSDQQLAESVVQYAPGHQAEAKAVSRRVGIGQREPVNPSSRALAGDATVIVIAGADKSP